MDFRERLQRSYERDARSKAKATWAPVEEQLKLVHVSAANIKLEKAVQFVRHCDQFCTSQVQVRLVNGPVWQIDDMTNNFTVSDIVSRLQNAHDLPLTHLMLDGNLLCNDLTLVHIDPESRQRLVGTLTVDCEPNTAFDEAAHDDQPQLANEDMDTDPHSRNYYTYYRKFVKRPMSDYKYYYDKCVKRLEYALSESSKDPLLSVVEHSHYFMKRFPEEMYAWDARCGTVLTHHMRNPPLKYAHIKYLGCFMLRPQDADEWRSFWQCTKTPMAYKYAHHLFSKTELYLTRHHRIRRSRTNHND